MKEDLTGIDIVHLIGTSLQAAKDLVKEGNLSLGETAEIQLGLPDYPLIKTVLGRTDSVQVLYIDQNYRLITQTLVAKPSVVVLFGMDRLGHLWEKLDEEGNEILKKSFVLRYSPVFNIEQTVGIELPETVEVEIVEAEEYIAGAKAKPVIKYGGDKAFYYPEGDYIQVPPKKQFTSPKGYYETLFHEIGHWTGRSNRLSRNMGVEQTTRAREELLAEMFAGFCLHKVGLDADVKNVAAYVQSWIRALMDDKKAVPWASREAKKAVQFFESGIVPEIHCQAA
ncbi:MAG: hypothetical protein LUQ38_06625 [Methanotrichaceae archaeon]|nr:hypothetical protein [Methanotrichaceae archaeon]